MKRNQEKIAILSTFTVEPIRPSIKFWANEFDMSIDLEVAPYNQIFQELLNESSLLKRNSGGINVILFKVEDWLRYHRVKNEDSIENSSKTESFKERQQYLIDILNDLLSSLKIYLRQTTAFTVLLMVPNSFFLVDESIWKKSFDDFQLKLATEVNKLSGIDLVMAKDWHQIYDIREVFDQISDNLGHIPFRPEYYNFLGTLIFRRIYAFRNKPYKVIVTDCDNTLWKGICGEVGASNVQISEYHKKFQDFLVEKSRQGMLICLCSKNDEEDVWNVFDAKKDMPLKREMVVAEKINWYPKSQNISAMAQSLNLGLDSFIFIDDNPVECAEVRVNCPEVFTIQFPLDKAGNEDFYWHVWPMDQFMVSKEDKMRTTMYKANISRNQLQEKSVSFKAFLESLNLNIQIHPMGDSQLKRVSQLTQRTNQFNFTTVRRSEVELISLLKNKKNTCWTVEVDDRFGSYGIVGVFIIRKENSTIYLDTFLLSCRVLGRGVEHRMMNKIGEIALENDIRKINIIFRPTQKNKPANQFLEVLKRKLIHEDKEKQVFQVHSQNLKECKLGING